MKPWTKKVDGVWIDMTVEEIAEIKAQATEVPAPTPTIEERVASLEATSNDVILMMAELIGGDE